MKIISEIGSNHNNEWNRCEKLIKKAKECGFTGVKFQLFKAELLTKDIEKQKIYKEQELNIDWIPKISELCKKLNLSFGCTPFYLEAVDILKDYVDFFKISSFDILRRNLIQKCLETKKDVYFSCGLATVDDILNIVDLIMQYGTENNMYYFLHCISKYPTSYNEASIKRMNELFNILLGIKNIKKNMTVGYSDHTKDVDVIKEAISNFAQVIEMHFDIDGKGSEYKYGHCWLPKDMENLYEKMIKADTILNKKFELTEEQLKLRADSVTGLRS